MWQTKTQKIEAIQHTRKIKNLRRNRRQRATAKALSEANDRASIRKFASAKTGRLVDDWQAGKESINSDIKNSIERVRQRSKDLSLNNDYIRKYLKLFRKNVVGEQGFKLKSLVRDSTTGELDEQAISIIELAWKDFGRKENFSATGELGYFKFMTMFATQYPTDGEYFIHYVYGDDYKYGFALEVIDARLLDHDLNRSLKNGNFIRLGIEFDSMGRRVQYYFRKANTPKVDEYNFTTKNYNTVPAKDILHIYDKEDCTQVRGYPLTQIALLKSHNIGSYEESELIAARVSSNKMGFFEQTQEAGEYTGEDQTDGSVVSEAEAGTFEVLPQGMSFKAFDPNHPNGNMPDFVKNQLRGIASGLDVSYNTLASDGEGINFSTMRSFALDDRDGWKMLQRMVKEDLLSPVFEKFVEMALLKGLLGRLPASKVKSFKMHDFIARTFTWVDPLKDIQAYALGIKLGIYSRTRVCQETGLDYKDVIAELKKEEELAGEIDISGANTNISLQEGLEDGQDQEN